jgi:antitoxin component of MazEF toxin-antitoxin module
MAYVKTLTKVGNSTALIIDRPFLDQLNLETGAEVEVSIERNRLIIQPRKYVTREQGREVLARVTSRHRASLEKLAK